jgi:putative oxidoreductase
MAMAAPGLLALRGALAVVFVAHGAHRLFGVWGGAGVGPAGLDAAAAAYTAAGLEPGFLIAVLGGLTQFVGGLLLGAGFLTRWAAFALLLHVLVQVWFEQMAWGLFLDWTGEAGGHGMEYSIVLAGALLCLLMLGAGDASVDGLRSSHAEARAAARARVRSKF